MEQLSQPNRVAAYLYLHCAEQMPEDADWEWFLLPEPNPVHLSDVEAFLEATSNLLDAITEEEVNSEESIQTLFYDAAKATFNGDKKMIRTYFRWLYLVLFQSHDGPRWGVFVSCMGTDRFVEFAKERFSSFL